MDIQDRLASGLAGIHERMGELQKQMEIQNQLIIQQLRGIKWMRLPLTLQGTASGGALNLGEASGQVLGPKPGYLWSLNRLVVDGLTTGATPDVVNLYRSSSTGQPPLWQFNGNTFGYTFSDLNVTLMGGDTLNLISVGSFAATGTIRLSGELLEVPAEMVGKLVG
jgi:hypothetical protein